MAEANNPFMALFGISAPAPSLQEEPVKPAGTETAFNEAAEKIFGLTLKSIGRKPGQPMLFYMRDLAEALKQDRFDQSALDQAVLDYTISMEDPIVDYLYRCYERSMNLEMGETVTQLQSTIYSHLRLALAQPELFPDQPIHQQFLDLLGSHETSLLLRFLENFVSFALKEDDPSLEELFCPLLLHLKTRLAGQLLILGDRSSLDCLLTLAAHPRLAEMVVKSSLLPESSSDSVLGRHCEHTLLGTLFTTSCIPSNPSAAFDFFERPSRSPAGVHAATEANIWAASHRLMSKVHKIFYTLLKSSNRVQQLTRSWLGQVLTLNKARGQTWTQHHSGQLLKASCVSDGFMVNLSAMLLQLCKPFTAADDPKAIERLKKIDPAYGRLGHDPENGANLKEFNKETCLIGPNELNIEPMQRPFSFSTELFFMTHRSLELGNRTVHAQLVKLSQELTRLQRAYQDAQGQSSQVAEQIQERMDLLMSSYLCLKAVLLVPEWLDLHYDFSVATSQWLCSQPAEKLSNIPELCLSNVMDMVVFISRFSPATFDRLDLTERLQDLLSLVIVFMGSPERLKNPHMRAGMAEMLDALMPPDRAQSGRQNPRTELFLRHPQADQVVRTLLHVFVSIEMTGQGVAFEQKFNYRRPMYAAMKFLWTLPPHRRQFKALAEEAEAGMDSAQAPLFLKFVNLLINDAIYLLDEGLSYMAQLKEQQRVRGTDGSWLELGNGPEALQQRQQREATYQHITMLARFHNQMGRETIRILEMLTARIEAVFVHPTIVDRVASMLNYFLLHLVGPKKRDFKVKDFGDYEFEPAELVECICKIYCHLGRLELFCSAVSRDGRSYSPQLFQLAQDVLSRTGRSSVIGDLQLVADQVARLAAVQQCDDELLGSADVPDEFLDPIMSTLMTQPVTLPSSRVTVDRSTIARHLLSDQSDPFNRSPLTMEDVLPDLDLQKKIEQWMDERKKQTKLQQEQK